MHETEYNHEIKSHINYSSFIFLGWLGLGEMINSIRLSKTS